MAAGARHRRSVCLGRSTACPDECAQVFDHNTILRKLPMDGGNGERKASRSLSRFVPAGVCVFQCVFA